MSENPPPQFTLRTLLLVMTALAVLCGLLAWCGLTGAGGALAIAMILAASVGAFVGLLICSYADLGFGFEDVRWDALKCVALAAIVVPTAYGLACWAPIWRLQAISIIVLLVSMKLLWFDIEVAEMLIVGFCILSAAGIVAAHIVYWMGG